MTNSTPSALKLPSEETSSKLETTEGLRPCKKTKAAREKARREKMNERFACLAKLTNTEDPKVDKASILADTIRVMKAQKEENDQLKQIIKFLEEKVTLFEKERNLALYHRSLMFNSKPLPSTTTQFPYSQECLFPTNQVFDFENQMTAMGTPLEANEDTQDISNGSQDLNSQWLTTIEASPFHHDDFLHPPAA